MSNARAMAGVTAVLVGTAAVMRAQLTADLHQELAKGTPRRSGRARAGWRVVGAGARPPLPAPPYAETARQEAERRASAERPGRDVDVANSVPYLADLNRRLGIVARALDVVGGKGR